MLIDTSLKFMFSKKDTKIKQKTLKHSVFRLLNYKFWLKTKLQIDFLTILNSNSRCGIPNESMYGSKTEIRLKVFNSHWIKRPHNFAKYPPYFCLYVCTVDKIKVEISQNLVAFSEYTNFRICGFYYAIFILTANSDCNFDFASL